jgi:hypothetical protein
MRRTEITAGATAATAVASIIFAAPAVVRRSVTGSQRWHRDAIILAEAD